MTKKHYKAIAYQLHLTKPDIDSNEYAQWERDVRTVADACENLSPTFGRQKFLDFVDQSWA